MKSERLVTEYEYQGSSRGATHAVLLAHGAGADMHAPALRVVADALAEAKIPSLRFNYRYRTLGRRAPDSKAILATATREAVAELARRSGLPHDRLIQGGRSMGGRMCSQLVASNEHDGFSRYGGLLLLGYPLKPAGKSGPLRDEHFNAVQIPTLFVSGTRDALAPRADLERSAQKIRGPVTFHWLESADHSFRPLKASGLTIDDVLSDVAATCVTWIRSLHV